MKPKSWRWIVGNSKEHDRICAKTYSTPWLTAIEWYLSDRSPCQAKIESVLCEDAPRSPFHESKNILPKAFKDGLPLSKQAIRVRLAEKRSWSQLSPSSVQPSFADWHVQQHQHQEKNDTVFSPLSPAALSFHWAGRKTAFPRLRLLFCSLLIAPLSLPPSFSHITPRSHYLPFPSSITSTQTNRHRLARSPRIQRRPLTTPILSTPSDYRVHARPLVSCTGAHVWTLQSKKVPGASYVTVIDARWSAGGGIRHTGYGKS